MGMDDLNKEVKAKRRYEECRCLALAFFIAGKVISALDD